MKWLGKFRKRDFAQQQQEESDADAPATEGVVSPSEKSAPRPQLKDWFQARAARTSIPTESKRLKTTEKLQVSKAGVTTLINRTYIVIKHIGSGMYGQVKLAFNLRDKKLYAIKACRKSQLGVSQTSRSSGLCRSGPSHSGRSLGLNRSRRSLPQLPRSFPCPPKEPKPEHVVSETAASEPLLPHLSNHTEARAVGLWACAMAEPVEPTTAASAVPSPSVVHHPSSVDQMVDVHIPRNGHPPCNDLMGPPSTSGQDHAAAPPVFTGMGRDQGRGGIAKVKASEFVREIAILKKLAHKNIVKLVEVIDDPASDNLLLVMEYVEGSSLQPKKIEGMRWEPVEEQEAWQRARDVVEGLDYLHLHGVVHGDLKPANLMQANSTRQVKIVDFGSAMLSSTIMNPGTASAFCCQGAGPLSCTPAFRSPESLVSGYRPSVEMDMWALGVTIYMWIYGVLPFSGSAPFVVYDAIKRQELQLPSSPCTSSELRDFLTRLLDKSVATRLNVVGACQHPWITGNGTAPLSKAPLQRMPSIYAAATAVPCSHDICMSAHVADVASTSVSMPPLLQWRSEHSGPNVFGQPTARSLPHIPEAAACAACMACPDSPSIPFFLSQPASDMRALTEEDIESAISKSVGGSAVAELMGTVFEEISLPPHSVFISAGDPVDKMYLITQGEVELYQSLEANQRARPIISGVHSDDVDMEDDEDGCVLNGFLDSLPSANLDAFTNLGGHLGQLYNPTPALARTLTLVDLLASANLDAVPNCGGQLDLCGSMPEDMITFSTVREVKQRQKMVLSAAFSSRDLESGHSSGALSPGTAAPRSGTTDSWGPTTSSSPVSRMAVSGGGLDSNLIVLATKGPGESLGLTSLQPQKGSEPFPTWQASARTVNAVIMFKADVSNIHRLVRLYPELEVAMKSIVVQQETDLKVAEALRELRIQAAAHAAGQLKHSASVPSCQAVSNAPQTSR